MNTITIPKKLAKTGDLIVLPRREYDTLLLLRRRLNEFSPTVAQKRALLRAENNLRRGKTLSYNELRKKLEFTD